ncbi:E3 ubiquitin-protein ligase listerin [Olea europaea var. sylvestris]|uniref:E3 ubiquitin-protein ligase listerin n=1 Tax=Olea europaea var. sylvestris TaxID=158386 RepID=UPI000C1D0FE8|nr:E3 ubiquitin-protein ligase listerin [Olea europaea var. sylvestris]
MGRPKGEAARSKSRPSSSSLAASLVPSGATAVGFGGYVGSSRVDSSLASTPEASSFMNDLDGEMAQHLKRLSRKDPTTKLKALTSLSQHLKQKTAKEIVPIIPQWAFEYRKLLLDYNREVRRATHDTMTNLVDAVGRDLAPHLKPLIGPWWFSQFDSVYEVSQTAKRSFQTAFPAQEKRLDALMLYAAEIFLYIEENLKLTPQSLSDKTIASDELEEMHQQVVSSSLLALATLLDVLVSGQFERSDLDNMIGESKHAVKARAMNVAVSSAEKLFSAHKYFLDFLKSQSPAIRSATYSVLRSYIKNIPDVVNKGDMKSLAVTILGAFQERNPACHSSMWQTVLIFSRTYPDSWTTLNVQKIILSRLWDFLKNGCFGSQQVSYPALVLFLDTIPPKAVVGEKFILQFFQNLWAGRKLSYFSNGDQLAFFVGLEECFLWTLRNASRYCDGVEAIYSFQRTLVDTVVIGLLWHEYLLAASSKYQDTSFSETTISSSKCSTEPVDKESRETFNVKYPADYEENLGKCIIRILSGIHCLKHDLLLVFCSTFQGNCLDLFRQTERSSQNVEWAVKFLILLDEHAVQKGESWPLVNLLGPTLKESFPVIETSDSPDSVRLIVVAVSVFGPQKIIQGLISADLGTREFFQYFNERIIPSCLREVGPNASRLDLLLALLDEECFSEQWNAIIMYLINSEQVGVTPGTVDNNKISILAMLIEKVRERTRKHAHLEGSCSYEWHHELLDSAALSIIHSFPPFRKSDAHFLCAVLGGGVEDDKVSFLSRNTSVLIYEEIFRILMTFMLDSSFIWVKNICSLLSKRGNYSCRGFESSTNVLEMAHFALDILNGSFFCLKTMNDETELVSGILAAIFIIDWEFNVLSVTKDENQMGEIEARLTFCQAIHIFRSKIYNQFFESLSINNRNSLGTVLVESIKCIIFMETKLDYERIISLCCQWMGDIFEYFCKDQFEEQQLLEQLLTKNDWWPLWIMPDNRLGSSFKAENGPLYASKNTLFVALLDKLISRIGFARVIAAATSPSLTGEPIRDLPTNNLYSSRAWLAAEILCTWKWLGGSALHSFLPSLSEYVKHSSENCLLDSIVSILLDGALVQGAGTGLSPLWPASYDEVQGIEEPFLRALVSLLLTFFQDDIWGKGKAVSLFNALLDKLYIGDTTNLNCLRILSSVMSILIRPLSIRLVDSSVSDECDYYSQSKFHESVVDWLERTVSFPPLNTWQTGEDMEDFFQLVISCFPIKATEQLQGLKQERYISPVEKELLYKLFEKQRQHAGASAVVNKLPLVQRLLSQLVVVSVAYCWEEFNEDDWNFVLTRSRFWIESTVVMMEEVAENVNDAVSNCSSSNDMTDTLKKLKIAVSTIDPFPIKLATNALLAFSLFCGLMGLQKKEYPENSNPLRIERWEVIKDRILEGILRLFFSTGVAEAIANSYCQEASSVVASSRLDHPHFWELVASRAIESSSHARDKALKSIEIWGLSKGPISSLYALLFSCKPLPPVQFAAFVIISTEPVMHSAFKCDAASLVKGDTSNNEGPHNPDISSEGNVRLREEISHMLEKFPEEVFEMDLVANERVNIFLAWSLFLSHLGSLPSTSSERERMVQYVQDSINSVILDCLLQHIQLELYVVPGSRRKDVELPATVSEAATAATRAIRDRSVLFCIESLWPVGIEKMASLAGGIFGLMLHILPAYVRGWFSDIRNRSTSSSVESFTKAWCSPTLVTNELSQIKKASFADENFSISVRKSANEVVATYSKDETGIDLVIRLPPSYPLRPVDVDCTRSLGISELKQRKWLMSMKSFVCNQNGALAEAIRIWKSNFDKEFEGVEECPICYSVIHTANHSLPRLACKTCKHKFHSACLYKWFSTSHKSTCPLCQSPF